MNILFIIEITNMAQTLKYDVNKKIKDSALKMFFKMGYIQTTIGDISADAGISTGNIYRYYKSKDELFYSLITPEIIKQMMSLLKLKISAVNGLNIADARLKGTMDNADSTVLEFIVKYRMHIIIAIDKSQETKYQFLKKELIDFMIKRVHEYLLSIGNDHLFNTDVKKHMLEIIYTNFIQAFLEVIKRYDSNEKIIESYRSLLEYHYMGINKFME